MLSRRRLRASVSTGGCNHHAVPRNPVSSATEKWEQSALKDAERTKGPVSESRMGLVFIVGWGGLLVNAEGM